MIGIAYLQTEKSCLSDEVVNRSFVGTGRSVICHLKGSIQVEKIASMHVNYSDTETSKAVILVDKRRQFFLAVRCVLV